MSDIDQLKFASRLKIDPADNVILGGQAIVRYLGISSINTFYAWVERYGFPALKRPDGLWMTTMTSVDQWIFLIAEISADNRRAKDVAVKAAKAVGLIDGRKEPKRPYISSQIDRNLRNGHHPFRFTRVDIESLTDAQKEAIKSAYGWTGESPDDAKAEENNGPEAAASDAPGG